MRVFLFGLFLRCTSLMKPWPKPVQLVLLVFNFIQLYQFYVSLGDSWCFLICFPSCLLNCSCMPVSTTQFSVHALLFRFIDIHVVIFAHHLLFTTPLIGEFWLPWILMSRSQSLELVDSSGCWSEWRSGSVDQRKAIWGPILSGPLARF